MACYKESLIRRCGNERNPIGRAGMLSAAVWNGNYGGAGLLRPHLGDPVTELAPFWGSHLIPLAPSPCLRASPVQNRLRGHPAALTPSAAWPRPRARASPPPRGEKSDPRQGAPPSPGVSLSFHPWALVGESGLFLSPDLRALTSPPSPALLRAFCSSSNF